jgi:polar amino acid transport system substrate-binding protein
VAYETALYYANLEPSVFEVGGAPYFKILTGIGIAKSNQGLEAALKGALQGLMKDGSYAAVFTKWHLEPDMLPQ